MTPEQFVYWLQGYAEITQKAPSDFEWNIIKDHLATVFKKETPNRMPYPLGPAVAEPAKPNVWPYPGSPVTPWTSPGIPPTITCSTAPGAGTNWSSTEGSTAYSMTSNVPTVKYDYFTTARKETIRKINEELARK